MRRSRRRQFAGHEIQGKKLGVIGLGAIGVLVANAATHLGMEVYGYDPYVSVDAAMETVPKYPPCKNGGRYCIKNVITSPFMYRQLEDTKGMIDKDAISLMKNRALSF